MEIIKKTIFENKVLEIIGDWERGLRGENADSEMGNIIKVV